MERASETRPPARHRDATLARVASVTDRGRACYAALDLGTNNCRLLIATPDGDGFRVVESFSRIVAWATALSRTGSLDEDAMERTTRGAPHLRRQDQAPPGASRCARWRPRPAAAADQRRGLRQADRERYGILHFTVITPQEEAKLSVAGCLNLLDRSLDAALVIDVGGGSTELSWVDMSGARNRVRRPSPPGYQSLWASSPWPSGFQRRRSGRPEWFRAMVEHIKIGIQAFPHAEGLREVFAAERAHLVGTSGAITSLAGMHLGPSPL